MVRRKKDEDIILKSNNEDSISMLAEIQTEPDELMTFDLSKEIPVLPLRNMSLFPLVVMPVTIGRSSSLKLVNAAFKKRSPIVVVSQIAGETDDPGYKDLYHIGVLARVIRIFEMPGGNTTAILQSAGPKVNLENITRMTPYLQGMVTPIEEMIVNENTEEFKALMDTTKELAAKYLEMSDRLAPDLALVIKNQEGEILINFICANFPFPIEEKIQLLKYNNLNERIYRLIQIMNREVRLAEIKQNIQMRTREDIDRQQREYFLHQQMKNIQDELGDNQDSEIEELRIKGESKKWSKEVAETFERELSKLERINPQSPDYNVQLTYLQTILSLPWGEYTVDNLNINNAEKTLNKDHYGLEKVKERILEHLAVLKLKDDMKSPIVCLYGPPGVGKTSYLRE